MVNFISIVDEAKFPQPARILTQGETHRVAAWSPVGRLCDPDGRNIIRFRTDSARLLWRVRLRDDVELDIALTALHVRIWRPSPKEIVIGSDRQGRMGRGDEAGE